MAERGFARNLVSLLLIVGTGVGLYNVYSDNSELKAQAARLACSERPCDHELQRESRSPISQSFTFRVELKLPKDRRRATVDVDCRRAFWLVGEYECKAQGTLP
ncbi:MAG TPA: hypothetical protein VFQ61_12700 [Polyangiaceae bacterium]|nr:hypothetical protein [Polyangiaceae bacterium]